ncbi:MAG: TrmB family transcriptional regulator [Nostocoides sp.]
MSGDAQMAQLCELGLTAYEAKAYLALITRGQFTAAELARQAHIPRQRVYDVLDGLIRRGLGRIEPGPVRRFTATSPDRAIELLVTLRREAFDRTATAATTLAADLQSTWATGRNQDSDLEYVEILRDRPLVALRFKQMIAQTRTQLLVWSKLPFFMAEDDPSAYVETRRMADLGVDNRCLYERSVLDEPTMPEQIRAFIDNGEDARFVDHLPMKMAVTDGHRAMYSLTDPVANSLTATNMFIDHEALAQSLVIAFEQVWKQSVTLRTALRKPPTV